MFLLVWGPGSLAGLVIGVIVCAVLAFVAIKVSKKEGATTQAILATLSEEEKNEMMNQTYTKAEGKDMYTTNAFIVSITQEAEKSKVLIMFYMQEHQAYWRLVRFFSSLSKKSTYCRLISWTE